MRQLNIKFDSKVAYSIMQGDPQVISKMVYQLKMTMDRLAKFSAPVSIRPAKLDGTKPLPNVPARPSHAKFNEKTHQMFDKSIRQMIENQNETMMTSKLQRYKDEEDKQKADMEQFKHDTNAAAVQKIQDIRTQRMNQKKVHQTIMKEMGDKNDQTWQENQDKRKERLAVKRRVTDKLNKTKTEVIAGMRQEDKVIVVDQIRAFERRLSKMDEAPRDESGLRSGGGGVGGLGGADKRGMEKDVKKQMNAISKKKHEVSEWRAKRARAERASELHSQTKTTIITQHNPPK